jgi:multidrug resistance efflux pump
MIQIDSRVKIGLPALAALLLSASCADTEEKVLPEQRTITQSVYSSVTVQPDSLYQVFAAVSGLLEINFVEEGEVVGAGTPLMQITNAAPKLIAENAALNLQLASENYAGNNAILKSLEDEISAARLKVKNDSINYYRQKKLWDNQIGSEAEYDNRKLAYELSSNELARLSNRYERTRTELKTQLEQAQNNYKTATINIEDFTISSEISGTVYALYKEPGEMVNSMEPLAALGSSEHFLIEMLVDEVDIVKLRKGQRALITLDAYETQVFEAVVSKIYPQKDERTQTFKIEAVFNDPPQPLYPGLAGEGNIIVAEREAALTIPKTYLINGDKVKTEDGLVVVKLGLENLELVEVVSGLDADTYVYKPGE